MRSELNIHSMYGLGDNIFIRPFVRAAASRGEVAIATPWPELFEDLGVKFHRIQTNLRTQQRNVNAQPSHRWLPAPKGYDIRCAYGHTLLMQDGSITRCLERQLPLGDHPYVFDLPEPAIEITQGYGIKPLAIIRPVTHRKEWLNVARSPKPEYVNWVAEQLMATHYVIVIADLANGIEWIEGQLPPHHRAFLKGELNIKQLIAYVRAADVVVGGVGWIVPMAIAARTPAFILLGGQGAHNAPSVITDPRQDLSRIAFARPDQFCPCSNMRHQCNKLISNLPEQWQAFKSNATTGYFRSWQQTG